MDVQVVSVDIIKGSLQISGIVGEKRAIILEKILLPKRFWYYIGVKNVSNFRKIIQVMEMLGYKINVSSTKLICDSEDEHLYQILIDNRELCSKVEIFQIECYDIKTFFNIKSTFLINNTNKTDVIVNPESGNLYFMVSMNLSLKHATDTGEKFKFISITNSVVNISIEGDIKYNFSEKIVFNQENIYNRLPILSFDLEVSSQSEIFPRGITKYEFITSISAVLSYNNLMVFIFYVLMPKIDGDNGCDGGASWDFEKFKAKYIERIRREYGITEQIKFIPNICNDEFELIRNFLADFSTGNFLSTIGLPKSHLSIVTGYNISAFDLPFLVNRIIFHNKLEYLQLFSCRRGKIEFNEKLLYLDMFLVQARFFKAALGQNLKLSNVTKTFLGDTKIDLDVTLIRDIYSDREIARKCLHESGDFITGLKIPTMDFLMYYNAVDSFLVISLMRAQNITYMLKETLSVSSAIVGLISGMSGRMIQLMNMFLLNLNRWLTRQDTSILPRTEDLFEIMNTSENALEILRISYKHGSNFLNSNFIRSQDTVEASLVDLSDDSEVGDALGTAQEETAQEDQFKEREIEHVFEILFGNKGFGGGANAALPGIYTNVYGSDFQSFYPSIIKEYNIGFNNVAIIQMKHVSEKFISRELMYKLIEGGHYLCEYDEKFEISDLIRKNIFCLNKRITTRQHLDLLLTQPLSRVIIILQVKSTLKDLVQYLLDSRGLYKKLKVGVPKDSAQYAIFDAKEKDFKAMSCAIFGCMGCQTFGCPACASAAAITHCARNNTLTAAGILYKYNFKTVYIDTDGIYYYGGDGSSVEAISQRVTDELGGRFLLLEPEDVSSVMAILSKKKYVQYAGSSEIDSTKITCKGFEKNAPQAVKFLINKWTCHVISHLLNSGVQMTLNFSKKAFLLASFIEIHELWLADWAKEQGGSGGSGDQSLARKWGINLQLNERSVGGALTEYINSFLNRGYAVGSRIMVYYVYAGGIESIMQVDEEFPRNFIFDYRRYFKKYFKYMICIANSSYTLKKEEIDEVWHVFHINIRQSVDLRNCGYSSVLFK